MIKRTAKHEAYHIFEVITATVWPWFDIECDHAWHAREIVTQNGEESQDFASKAENKNYKEG